MNEQAKKPSLRVVALAVGGVIYALWLIRIADDMFALELYRWGIYPREISGLTGLLLGPLIHGSTLHLFANTLPLFVLGTATVYVSQVGPHRDTGDSARLGSPTPHWPPLCSKSPRSW